MVSGSTIQRESTWNFLRNRAEDVYLLQISIPVNDYTDQFGVIEFGG